MSQAPSNYTCNYYLKLSLQFTRLLSTCIAQRCFGIAGISRQGLAEAKASSIRVTVATLESFKKRSGRRLALFPEMARATNREEYMEILH